MLKSCLFTVFGIFLLLSILVYLFMPYSPKTSAELYGDYVLDCPQVKEELRLNSDGTFKQTITVKLTSSVASSDGNWSYQIGKSSVLRYGDIEFKDGYVVALSRPDDPNPVLGVPRQNIVSHPVKYWFGTLYISLGDDWPSYKKVR